ncbi:MAG: hypothetical protein ACLQM8_25820 [Limisphaerales bacterium]
MAGSSLSLRAWNDFVRTSEIEEQNGPIRVTALPAAAEIDAAEKWTQGEVQ